MIKPEIIKRVHRQNYNHSPYKCYICGEHFKLSKCPHSVNDQIWAVEEVQKQELLHDV